MTSISDIKRNTAHKPPRGVIFGPHGIGKSTLAAGAPNPVFLQTEDGLGSIDAASFGVLKSFNAIIDAIGALYNEDHDYRTLVIDSLDWLEPLIWQQVCADNNWKSIEDAGYGKGYVAAVDHWRLFLDAISDLRDTKGMGVLMIAHAAIQRFDSPETEPYDRYVIKLHKSASALVQEHVDMVLFNNYQILTTSTDLGFKKKATRGVGTGTRLLFTSERPANLAKNRYSMPDQITLPDDPAAAWPALAEHIPFYALQKEAV